MGYTSHPYRSEPVRHRGSGRPLRSRAMRLVALAVLGGGLAAYLAWPRLKAVETGRTPEYADLQPREYDRSPAAVTEKAKAAVERLGWTYVGGGSGVGGSEISATVRLWHLSIPCLVRIHVKGSAHRSTMSVRSESNYGPYDFGQNARNIRAFLNAMD